MIGDAWERAPLDRRGRLVREPIGRGVRGLIRKDLRMSPLSPATMMVSDDADDGVLLARMETGDATALALLYDRYSTAVYGLATHLLRNPSAAEAAVEEAFLTVWRRPTPVARGRGTVASRLLSVVWQRAYASGVRPCS